jgi:Domain of unknown function (DUF1707)
MTGPGDEIAAGAGGHGNLRASHADREQVIDVLKAAFVQGMLTKGELDVRAGQAFASRTCGDLAAITADLPTGLAGTQTPGAAVPGQARPPANRALLWGSWAVILLTIGFMAGLVPFSALAALVAGVLPLLIAAPIAGTLTLDAWREKHSDKQPPPRAAPYGHATGGEPGSGTGDDLIPCQARRDIGACHLPRHSVFQHLRRSLLVRQGQRRPEHLMTAA